MSTLTNEYLNNLKVYLRKKTNVTKKSENERKSHVLKFLKYCETLGVKKIHDITNDHYRSFVSIHLNSKSTSTKRKYLLALREFFQRAHLKIPVNVTSSIARTKQKKLLKIIDILQIDNISEQKKNEILKLL